MVLASSLSAAMRDAILFYEFYRGWQCLNLKTMRPF